MGLIWIDLSTPTLPTPSFPATSMVQNLPVRTEALDQLLYLRGRILYLAVEHHVASDPPCHRHGHTTHGP